MQKQEAIKDELAEARVRVLEVVRELDREEWTHPVYVHEEETKWTAGDVLRHLVWAEGGMLRMMRQVKEGGTGVPEDFEIDRYNAKGIKKLKEKMPAELLEMMEQNRQQVLAFIDGLAAEDWEKEGRHGSLRVMTIEEVLETIAAHEAQHLEDLREALGRLGSKE